MGYDSESKGYRIGNESVSVLSEGEMEGEKVIQQPPNRVDNPDISEDSHEQSEKDVLDQNTPNTIPFPMEPETPAKPEEDDPDDEQQNAALACFEDFDDENQSQEEPDCIKYESVLVATHPSDPKTLDEGLRGPDAKHWEEALQGKQLYHVVKL